MSARETVDAVVVAAMAEETHPYLRGAAEPVDVAIGTAHRLTLRGRSVIVLQSGIGLVNAAAATAALVAMFAPKVLISSGSAGGLAQGINVGDVVVGSSYAYHDADATNFGYVRGQIPSMPADYAGDPDLVALALSAHIPELRVRLGKVVSGDSFVYADTVDAVRGAFPAALAADMESAALAQLAHLLRMPFVSVRAISDLCGPHAGDDFSMTVDEVSERAASVVRSVIERITPAGPR